IYDGLFEFTHKGLGTSSMLTSSVITGGNVRIGGNFKADYASTWMQAGGTIEFFGDAASTIECSPGNYFYDMIVDKGAGTEILTSDVTVLNDFTLESGVLDTDIFDMNIGGDWTNNVGPAAFLEGTNNVVFNGNTSGGIYSDEDFYILEVNKPDIATNLLHIRDGYTINVLNDMNILDGTLRMRNNTTMNVGNGMTLSSGAIAEFPAGYTNANLEVDGTMYLNSGSLLTMHTGDTAVFNSGFTNVGSVELTDASIYVHGLFSSASGSGYIQNSGEFIFDQTGLTWIYLRGIFEIHGGLFEFTHRNLSTSSLITSSVISGGTIRMGGNFRATDASTWMQTGGTMEFMGNADQTITCSSDNHFYNMNLTKNSGTATLASDINIHNDITLDQGLLDTDLYDLFIGGDWTNNAGPSAFDQGTNRVVFNKNQSSNIYSNEAFYDLEVDKPDPSTNYLHLDNNISVNVFNDMIVQDGRFRLRSNSNLNVANNMTLLTGTLAEMPSAYTNSRLEVDGTMDVKGAAVLDIHIGDSAIFNGTFILAGELNLTDAVILAHGFFSSATTSSFILNSGEFIYDETGSTWVYLRGNIKMYGGLFEVTHRHFSLVSTLNSNFQDGIFRLGGNFSAATAGTFLQEGGTTELIGDAGVTIELVAGNYFHDLDIKRGTGTASLISDIIVSRDFHMVSGSLKAIGYDIDVGRHWTNDAGPGTVANAGNNVTFFSDQPAVIFSDENFHDLIVNKPLPVTKFLEVDIGKTLNISGELSVMDGTLLLNKYNTIVVTENLGIQNGAGLNANISSDNVVIRCSRDFVDKNTVYDDHLGFNPGHSHVILEGNIDQETYQAGGLSVFYDFSVDKSGGVVLPFSDIRVQNEFDLHSGEWYYGDTGLDHEFYGDISIGSNGIWSDNINTVNILGPAVRYFENQGSGNTNFNLVDIDMMGKATALLVFNSDFETNNLIISDGVMDVNNNKLECANYLQVNQDGELFSRNNSIIAMGSGANFHIMGGKLIITGNTTQRPIITSLSGYYNFAIDAGGEFYVADADFEFMDDDGLRITQNGTIANSNPFENCSFKKGEPGGSLLWIENNQDLDIINANFYDNAWGGKYNIYKPNTAGTINFIDAQGSFAGEADEYDPNNLVFWQTSGYQVSLHAYLEGPYSGSGSMYTLLTSEMPLTQPYNTSPWNYNGTESVTSAPSDYVDWVLVELRDAASASLATSSTMIAQQAAFIRNDGRIVSASTGGDLEFTETINEDLYVVIWQRNHLGVMSANALLPSGALYTWNFSTGAGQVHGGSNGHKELDPGVWGLAGGDGNADGQINNGDKIDVWSVEAGSGGYLAGDFNLDSQVNNGDKNDIWIPNTGLGGQVPDSKKSCQVPE
ncbi:MAG: hypothetical protein K8R53_04110, partial [Bacteroidales bacterium]|nr:hypothetical protein [Bacteroidales bacterium]